MYIVQATRVTEKETEYKAPIFGDPRLVWLSQSALFFANRKYTFEVFMETGEGDRSPHIVTIILNKNIIVFQRSKVPLVFWFRGLLFLAQEIVDLFISLAATRARNTAKHRRRTRGGGCEGRSRLMTII